MYRTGTSTGSPTLKVRTYGTVSYPEMISLLEGGNTVLGILIRFRKVQYFLFEKVLCSKYVVVRTLMTPLRLRVVVGLDRCDD